MEKFWIVGIIALAIYNLFIKPAMKAAKKQAEKKKSSNKSSEPSTSPSVKAKEENPAEKAQTPRTKLEDIFKEFTNEFADVKEPEPAAPIEEEVEYFLDEEEKEEIETEEVEELEEEEEHVHVSYLDDIPHSPEEEGTSVFKDRKVEEEEILVEVSDKKSQKGYSFKEAVIYDAIFRRPYK